MIGAALRSLGRRHMDLSFRSGRDLTVRIVERPGLWMEPAALDSLTADLRRVAAQTLAEGSLTYGVFSGDRARMAETIITLIRRRDGTPVAFNALAVMTLDTRPQPTEVLHLGLVMVDPALRSRSLSFLLYGLTCFLLVLRRQFRPVWVSNVTQVPAVVGMVTTMFSDVWPAPAGQGAPRRTLAHLIMARQIMAHHRHVFGVGPEAGFDEARFVITDAYTGGSDDLKKTWEAAPRHRDEAFNAFCAQELDYDRGDDLLQLGRMDLAAVRRYLAREVPPSRLAGVLAAGALVLTGKLVLPVVHWFDAGRAWSILRPAK
jgi:hypothetical protein